MKGGSSFKYRGPDIKFNSGSRKGIPSSVSPSVRHSKPLPPPVYPKAPAKDTGYMSDLVSAKKAKDTGYMIPGKSNESNYMVAVPSSKTTYMTAYAANPKDTGYMESGQFTRRSNNPYITVVANRAKDTGYMSVEDLAVRNKPKPEDAGYSYGTGKNINYGYMEAGPSSNQTYMTAYAANPKPKDTGYMQSGQFTRSQTGNPGYFDPGVASKIASKITSNYMTAYAANPKRNDGGYTILGKPNESNYMEVGPSSNKTYMTAEKANPNPEKPGYFDPTSFLKSSKPAAYMNVSALASSPPSIPNPSTKPSTKPSTLLPVTSPPPIVSRSTSASSPAASPTTTRSPILRNTFLTKLSSEKLQVNDLVTELLKNKEIMFGSRLSNNLSVGKKISRLYPSIDPKDPKVLEAINQIRTIKSSYGNRQLFSEAGKLTRTKNGKLSRPRQNLEVRKENLVALKPNVAFNSKNNKLTLRLGNNVKTTDQMMQEMLRSYQRNVLEEEKARRMSRSSGTRVAFKK